MIVVIWEEYKVKSVPQDNSSGEESIIGELPPYRWNLKGIIMSCPCEPSMADVNSVNVDLWN